MIATLSRKEASLEAQRLLRLNPIYLDTETTGLGPNAEVIEIGVVDQDGNVLANSLVRPRGAVEPEAARLHGITPEMLAGAPAWAEVWPGVQAALQGRQVGVYNAEFDLRLIKQSHTRAWLRWDLSEGNFFCIMKLYARFFGEWDARRSAFRNQSLDNAGRQCGIPLPNSHRAVDDAMLTRALLHYMADQAA